MTGWGGTSLGTKTVVPGNVLTSLEQAEISWQNVEHLHIMVKVTYRT